jgi:PadR family transcriptional regulator, regulatory protein PadR
VASIHLARAKIECKGARMLSEILNWGTAEKSHSGRLATAQFELPRTAFLRIWGSSLLLNNCYLHRRHLFTIVEEMRKRDYLGSFELMVMLALIRIGDNAYGVPISREIEERSGREVALGSVYATLERLETKGLVSSELGEPTPERGGRAKKYFNVTAKGVREVRETQRVLMKLWPRLRQLEGRRV